MYILENVKFLFFKLIIKKSKFPIYGLWIFNLYSKKIKWLIHQKYYSSIIYQVQGFFKNVCHARGY